MKLLYRSSNNNDVTKYLKYWYLIKFVVNLWTNFIHAKTATPNKIGDNILNVKIKTNTFKDTFKKKSKENYSESTTYIKISTFHAFCLMNQFQFSLKKQAMAPEQSPSVSSKLLLNSHIFWYSNIYTQLNIFSKFNTVSQCARIFIEVKTNWTFSTNHIFPLQVNFFLFISEYHHHQQHQHRHSLHHYQPITYQW